MVPCLFGFPRAKVRALPRTDGAGPEEYEVTWSVPVEQARLAAYGGVVASLVGGIPGAFAGAAYGVASALVSAEDTSISPNRRVQSLVLSAARIAFSCASPMSPASTPSCFSSTGMSL